MTKLIILYTKTGCRDCDRAKMMLSEAGFPYLCMEVGESEGCALTRDQLRALLGREYASYPQIVRDGEYLGGYRELRAFLDSGFPDPVYAECPGCLDEE